MIDHKYDSSVIFQYVECNGIHQMPSFQLKTMKILDIERILSDDTSQPIRVGCYAKVFANWMNKTKSDRGIGRRTDCLEFTHTLQEPSSLFLCEHTQADKDVIHAFKDEGFVEMLLSSNCGKHSQSSTEVSRV